MWRLAASGHRPSRQFSKFAAALRIAAAFISGWPKAPDPGRSMATKVRGGGTAGAGRIGNTCALARHRQRRHQPVGLGPCRQRKACCGSGSRQHHPCRSSSPSLPHIRNKARRPLGQDMVARILTLQFTFARNPAAGSPPGPQPLDQLRGRIGIRRQPDLKLRLSSPQSGSASQCRPSAAPVNSRRAISSRCSSCTCGVVNTTTVPLPCPTGGAPASRVAK